MTDAYPELCPFPPVGTRLQLDGDVSTIVDVLAIVDDGAAMVCRLSAPAYPDAWAGEIKFSRGDWARDGHLYEVLP